MLCLRCRWVATAARTSHDEFLGAEQMLPPPTQTDRRQLPTCPDHPGTIFRRYRAHGPHGFTVYPQCVLPDGSTHLLAWPDDTKPAPARPRVADLSAAERAVLLLAADGFTVAETARQLQKSPETVKSQRGKLLMKLGVRNITQAVALAVEIELIPLRKAA